MRLASALAALERSPRIVLTALVVVQWIAVAALALTTPHNGWLFYQGGDETFYYTSAWELSEGRLPRSHIGFGWPLLLAPIALLEGANFLEALPLIVIAQFVLLIPIALLAVYGIAATIAGRAFGYWAAALWIAVPFAAIEYFDPRYHEKFAELFLPQAFGLSGLADFPSMVALLVAAYLLLRSIDRRDGTAALLGGVAAGFAIGVKPSNGIFLGGAALAFLLGRRWAEGGTFAAGTVPALLTLAIWKQRGLGELPVLAVSWLGPLVAGLPVVDLSALLDYVPVDLNHLAQHFDGLREFSWSVRVLQWLPVAGALAVARRSLPAAGLLGLWLLGYFVVKGSAPAATVESGSLFRFLMPALPAYLVLAAAIPLLLPRIASLPALRPPAAPALRWRSPLPLLAIGLLGIAPAVLFAVLPTEDRGSALKEFETGLFVPVGPEFTVRARVHQGTVVLDWERPGAGPTSVDYRIFRSPARHRGRDVEGLPDAFAGVQCARPTEAARDCSLEMVAAATTRETRWVDHPPAGALTYRIGLLGDWRGNQERADLLLVSEPVTVRVAGSGG